MPLVQRYSTVQRGAIVITGNTLGLSKGGGLDPGTLGSIGAFITTDTTLPTPAAWVGIENLANDENITLNWEENSSRANLNIPAGSEVLYAELIWGGSSIAFAEDVTANLNDAVNFITPNGLFQISPDPATAEEFTFTASTVDYTRSQDVTDIVRAAGSGTYEVGRVPSAIAAGNPATNGAGWTLLVAYRNSAMPVRRLDIYSRGVDINATAGSVDITVSGFATPSAGPINARLSISAIEGDASITGDTMLFGPTVGTLTKLSGPNNKSNPPYPAPDNFFGSQINIGDPTNPNVGQIDTTGTYGSRNQNLLGNTNIVAGRQGWDVTNVDASATLVNSQTSAVTRFTTNGDGYIVNGLGIQIDAVAPDITMVKSVDKTIIEGGEKLEYTIVITNNGTVTTDNFNFIDDRPVGTVIDYSSINVIGETGPLVDNSLLTEVNLELGPIGIGQVVTVIYEVTTNENSPIPIENSARGEFDYMPVVGTTISESAASNTVSTTIEGLEFECDIFGYQVVQEEISPGVFSNSQFRKINTVTGEVEIVNLNTFYQINAIGYNTLDNFIYGFATIFVGGNPEQHLVRIDNRGVVEDLGLIPNMAIDNGLNTGAMDDRGFLYFKRAPGTEFYTVDLRPGSPTFGLLVDPTNGYVLASPPYYTPINPPQATTADWTYNKNDGLLYTVLDAFNVFGTVDPNTGNLLAVPTNNPGGLPLDYGAMFSDADGFIYGISNSTGEIIRWENVGGTMEGVLFSETLGTIRNDAASCVNAQILLDFGDAPDTSSGNGTNDYSTLLENDGPRHVIDENLTLGSLITAEDDAYENPTATGDDLIEGIQDDAPIWLIKPLVIGDGFYRLPISYENNTGKSARIYGWLDSNRNGIFEENESSELLVVPTDAANPRETELVFNYPSTFNLMDGDTTFIRVRITTEPLVNSGIFNIEEDTRSLGPAPDGEVEDYQIDVVSLKIEGVIWYDLNCNGIREINEPFAEGITVELYEVNNDSEPLDTRTTDSNGYYLFDNLGTGEYYVKVTLKNGYSFTLPNVPPDDTIDSDVNKNTGESPNLVLDCLNTSHIIDAGLCRLNKISGQAFYDCNSNGLLDYDEPFICGVYVTLLDNLGIQIETVETDCDGYYEFSNLESGIYTVRVTAIPGANFTTQNIAAFYGSKPNVGTGEFALNLINTDYISGFIGFKGGFQLDMQYCINNDTCNLGCNKNPCENNCNNNNCGNCEGNCNSCNKECIGCKNKESNKKRKWNRVSCSNCDSCNDCDSCNKK